MISLETISAAFALSSRVRRNAWIEEAANQRMREAAKQARKREASERQKRETQALALIQARKRMAHEAMLDGADDRLL